MNKAARTISFILIAALLLSIPCAAAFKYSGKHEIKVGFFAFDGYHMQDENGDYSGYGYDYLMHLTRYYNANYTLVGYDKNWSDMLAMLESGEIDILTSAQKTPEREYKFDFSESPIGYSAVIMTVKAGNTDFSAYDYTEWNGIRVGMLTGNSRNDSFEAFAEENAFTYTPVYFSDNDELISALQEGDGIDAIVTSNLRRTKNEWIIAEFDPSPFYIMVQKDNSMLLDEINQAIADLNIHEPGLQTELWNRYYSADSDEEIAFTETELDFIAEMKDTEFSAILCGDCPPFAYIKNDAPAGIIYDLTREIIDRTGLDITVEFLPSRAQYNRALANHSYDIRLDSRYDYANAEENRCLLTAPYLSVAMSRLRLKSNDGPYTELAGVDSSDMAYFSEAFYTEDEHVTYYHSLASAITSVLEKKQDAIYLYTRSAEYYDYVDDRDRLVEEPAPFGTEGQLAIGVSKTCNSLVLSILNKAVLSLSGEDINATIGHYTSYPTKDFSLLRYIYANPLEVIAFVLLLCLITVLSVGFCYAKKKQRRDKKLFAEEERKNALLRDALESAEQAGTAKSLFLSRVSHEMRTPLNAILGFMTLAKEKGTGTAKVLEYMSKSELAAHQLMSIINDILDMSAIESGKMKISSEVFNFSQLISSVTSLYSTQCNEKGILFETRVISDIDEALVGDPLRVNQILLNLLSNSVKFTEKGSITLTIKKLHEDNSVAYLRFIVEDTGCGMSEDMLSRLFKPFEQERTDTAAAKGGSGLGLSIVKTLVGLLGGAITVESRKGAGTTFTVDLPFKRCDAGLLPESRDFSDMSVLLVDDDADTREYARLLFERLCVRYKCVSSGEELIDVYKNSLEQGEPFDGCFIDWKMPGMDGLQTTKALCEIKDERTRVVVVSAYDYSAIAEEANAAGADMIIAKPLFQSTVVNILMNIAGGAASVQEKARPEEISGRRALLVEDNELNQQVAAGLLKHAGMECEIANNGVKAVEMFVESTPFYYDVILMDIQMPEMNGYEATMHIRQSGRRDAKNVPIIAMTANAFPEDVARSLSSGMNAHFSKPINVDVMYSTIALAIKNRSAN